MLLADEEYDSIWERFTSRFGFRPSTRVFPGIDEPADSATWDLSRLDPSRHDALQAAVEHALRECLRPGEEVYWLDWRHVAVRFDPHRVGGTGRPPWPGEVYPDGDYYIHVTGDLRLGTFGHPWERTLCVFGADLRARLAHRLGEVLGVPLRVGGQAPGVMRPLS
ncbi:DUF2716 domain-containing protein [Bailinhaonella thermotolerans]|uniref:DUF2716 domain-containing protein n=1 Tax=Bailinhaonella thermotolerans TaxID=1070861 RepID=A0A3A4APN6_9ACTN|nr:DUF2716 domain-containing protein [Bailinhaonella thermotolerans]RJL30519.1 DUF2716 domain-containing protein [Bailinhaonella thermotolerans]